MTQKTRAEVDAAIAANVPDNSSQFVSPALVRSTFEDLMDSALWYDEGGAGPVESVNGYTGVVALVASDVGAIATGSGALLAGATFTGPVAFSGTTNSGLKVNSLTTTQRDLLTPAAGMVIYNSTTTHIEGYFGGSWADLGAADVDLQAEFDAIDTGGGAPKTALQATISAFAAAGGAAMDPATTTEIWGVTTGLYPITAQELGAAEAYVAVSLVAGDFDVDGALGWNFKGTADGNFDFPTVANLTAHRRSFYVTASGGARTGTASGVDRTSNIDTGAVVASGAIGRFDFYLDPAGDTVCEYMGADDWLLGGASGTVLESAYDAHSILAAVSDNTPAAVTVAEQRLVGRLTAGNIDDLTGAQAGGILAGPIEYPIPAGAMIPRTTSGAAFTTTETSANKVMSYVLAFDASADEHAQFSIYLPKGFNAGTVTARFKWSHPATVTNFDVTWAIQARAFTNDDALDQAFGTAVVVTDAGGTTGDIYTSPESGAITIAGTPTGQKTAIFQVYRDVDGNGTAGNDDLAVDAYLHEVIVTLTMSALTDA